ncbi:MAG: DUF2400 family protein, partial [Thermodesulfobacteriota bacterium]|nr:DUF2400 family protein [Thermodesulfobacteriota bacterium]
MSLFKDVDLVKEEPVVIIFSVNPDQLSALEITHSFQKMAPHDPVRYDFALTRLGIRKDTDITSFLDEFG